MGHQGLKKRTLIKKKGLDPNQYTLSLLQKGYQVGLVDQQTIDDIQAQLMLLLRDSIIKYTKGDSTSVKVETAQNILMSILYSIDAYISSFDNPEDGIAFLKAKTLKKIYEKGIELVASCFAATQILYQRIKNQKLNVQLKAYNSTINDALPEFIEKYGVVFNAHDTMASIDYPLAFDEIHISGCFYIKQYLEHLETETQFCNLFSKKDVDEILINYGRVNNTDYRELLINIFEVLLSNSIFAVLAGNSGTDLIISEYQYKRLLERLEGLDCTQLSSLTNEAIEALIDNLGISQANLKEYIRQFKTVFMPRFLNALEHGNLSNVIIIKKQTNYQFDITFNEGKRMTDDSFRRVVDRIIKCTEPTKKVDIIVSKIDSLEDFIDILKADCFFEDEFDYLFNALGDMELSILARVVFFEDMRTNPMIFSLLSMVEKPMEFQWQAEYVEFLQGLSVDRLKIIEGYINSSFQATDTLLGLW